MDKVAVIGAGVMGAGIAAHIANAGVAVRLLDRPGIAAAALARMRAEAGPFMSPSAADLVTPGDSDSNLDLIGDCDWIIEAVVERLDVKQDLYRRIDAARRPGAVVSSSTSNFPLARLVAGMPDAFRRDFVVTHFFNPPRAMRLLELVAGPDADPSRVRRFCDVALGKTVVECHDTPGLIANRIGAMWLQLSVNAARDLGLTVEQADAAMGRAAGMPKTGVVGRLDLAASLAAALPATDPLRATIRDWPPASGQSRPERPAELVARDLPGLLATDGAIGAHARRVLGGTLAYAAGLVPEVADDVASIDAAMRLGYGWKRGPFEMIDAIGADAVIAMLPDPPPPLLASRQKFYRQHEVLGLSGAYQPVSRPAGVVLLADVKGRAKAVSRNASAALWDLGDGVAGFELTSKMGSVDLAILDLLAEMIATLPQRFAALVIGHDGEHFSAGANLAVMLAAARLGQWSEIEALIQTGQTVLKALKYAPFPVVAAPAGLALGGGCEIALHSGAIQAHAELTIGLVECNVGLIPGWGGCGEMLERLAAEAAFAQILAARTSSSAADARALHLLRPGDGITMNRDRVLADAKARALAMVATHRPPMPPVFALPGRPAMLAKARESSEMTAHDVIVADSLAFVLSGGETTEAELLARERVAFLDLIRTPATQARIEHVLATGKKLRN